MTSPASTIDLLASRAGQFYSLPSVAMEVLELTANPRVDTRALKDCIENDPALTIRLLRVVNSSLFGLSREVSDLNQALALLGIKPLKLLVLGFSLPAKLFEGIAGEILGHYWRHTLTKAAAAREISESFWNQPGDEAFIAGLLQDLAVLLLIQSLGEPYVRLLEKSYSQGKNLAALETKSLGFDHTTLTAKLLNQWGLPPMLVEAVRGVEPAGNQTDAAQGDKASAQSENVSPQGETLRQILDLAERAARLLADGQNDALPGLIEAGKRYRNVSREQLEKLVDNLEENVRQLADVLALQLPGSLDYRDILARAHGQLAGVALIAAAELATGATAHVAEPMTDDLRAVSEALSAATRRGTIASAERPTSPPAQAHSNGPAASAVEFAPAASRAMPTAPPTLIESLEAAVSTCRRARCPLTLMLVELPEDETSGGASAGPNEPPRWLVQLCRGLGNENVLCQPLGRQGCAVTLVDCDRRQAAALGNELIRESEPTLAGKNVDRTRRVGLAVGAATVVLPPRNFQAVDLFTAASRCLYGSHASGGGVVKSIEIY